MRRRIVESRRSSRHRSSRRRQGSRYLDGTSDITHRARQRRSQTCSAAARTGASEPFGRRVRDLAARHARGAAATPARLPGHQPVAGRQLAPERGRESVLLDEDAVRREPAVLAGHGERHVEPGVRHGRAGGEVVGAERVGEGPRGRTPVTPSSAARARRPAGRGRRCPVPTIRVWSQPCTPSSMPRSGRVRSSSAGASRSPRVALRPPRAVAEQSRAHEQHRRNPGLGEHRRGDARRRTRGRRRS